MDRKPLISFYVIACNQEHLVAEAVSGALAQSWSPLEVVLSDDCSDDATFTIMQKMASEYRGPHAVVLNRNEKRLGTGAHINRIVSLCTGEWIVASAGDDVSVPERTESLYRYWASQGGSASLVYSNILEIKEDGSLWYALDFRKEVPGGSSANILQWDYRDRLANKTPPVHGASFGYPRKTFDSFGPLWKGVIFEDNVINWRAEITGGVLLCPDYLVRHRNHQGQLTNLYSPQALRDADARRRAHMWSDVQTTKQNIADTNYAVEQGWITTDLHQNMLKDFLNARIQFHELKYRLFFGTLLQRWAALLRGGRPLRGPLGMTELLFIAFPRWIYLYALKLKAGSIDRANNGDG